MSLPFTLSVETLSAEPLVVSLRGREAINEPYRFEVRVVVDQPADPPDGRQAAIDHDALLGARARLTLNVGRAPRVIGGIVTACELSSRRVDERRVLRLRLEPWLAALKHRSHWRIFHDAPVVDVVRRLLEPDAIPFEWRAAGEPTRKAHRSQRGERDLAFFHRMLAEEGIAYWFEQRAAEEVVVFADRATAYPPIPPLPALRYVGEEQVNAGEEACILGLEQNARLRPRAQTVRLYDFERPIHSPPSIDAPFAANAADLTGERLALQEFEHSREGLAPTPTDASRRLSESRKAARVARGTTLSPHAAPGHVVDIVDHPESSLNRRFVIGAVEHKGNAPLSDTAPERSYEAKLSLYPHAGLLLGDRPRAPLTRGLETATVMGPVAEEIHTDDVGRVQIRFHWDAETPGHPPVTAWVRVAQSWGGAGYGATFTPRVGDEVLIGYIDGDPDRPVIVGSLHNALNAAAPRFPHERTRNGIATRSSPNAGGGHLLMFEDKVGEELLEMRSSKTLTVTSVADTVQAAGGRLEVTVGADRKEAIGADASSSVGGTARSMTGKDREALVAQNDRLQVGGSSERVISGNVMDVVRGNVTTMIQGGRHTMVGATPGGGSDESLAVSGRYMVGASKGIRLQSPTEIEISVGASRISLLPDRIVLESPLIQLQASDAIKLAQGKDESVAASLVLQGGASLAGGTATVSSGQGAILVLDAEAKLDGALVKLNCGPGSGGGAEKVADDRPMGPATFRVLPDGLPPGTTSVTLVVATPSGEQVEREYVVGGTVTFEGRPGETFTLIEMRLGGTKLGYAEVREGENAANTQGEESNG